MELETSLTPEQAAWIESAKTYHPPTEDQVMRYRIISDLFKLFATGIYLQVPACADRTDALRKLQELKCLCNQAIALNGLGIAR